MKTYERIREIRNKHYPPKAVELGIITQEQDCGLQEVLLMWKNKRKEKNTNFEWSIMADTYSLTKLLDDYDLTKPLEEQSEETLQAILKLLV